MPIRYGLGQVVEVRFGPGHDDGRLTGNPEITHEVSRSDFNFRLADDTTPMIEIPR